jgi:hypothetical protein
MRRTHFAAVSALALLAASCAADPAFAQNQPPSGLPARGAVAGTDVIVDQPAGSATVQGAHASAIATYVQQTAAAGTSGQVQINNGGAFAGVTVSGDGTLSGSGALTVTKINGSTPGTFAFQNYGALPSASGSPPITAATVFPCIPAGTLDGCTGAQLLAYVTNGPLGADPTGGADSTSALQAWLNAGSPGVIPCGIYKTTATLTLELALNNGQQVRGSGSGSALLKTGGCYTVIRPTSAVAKALVIDGTPVSQYLMGIGLHDIAFDMTNMSDVSTSVAINQIQAYDVMYERVRVINDGANKRGWLFNAGAFTTTLLNTQANILDFEGTGAGNGVTTITVTNHDGFQVISNWANGLKFHGGAYQGAGTHFNFTNTADVEIATDVEGSGTYLLFNGANNQFIRSFAELGGMASGFTEVSGTCAYDCLIWDSLPSFATYQKGLSGGEISLNNQGSGLNNNRSTFLSGASNQDQYLWLGRTAGESLYGVAGNANDLVSGSVSGDSVFGSYGSGEATWLIAAGNPVAKLTTTSMALQAGVALSAKTSPQTFTSGSSSTDEYLYIGLTSGTSIVGVAAGANHFVNGTVSGDMVLGSYASGQHTWLACGQNPCWEGDAYGHQYTQGYPAPTAGAGTASTAGNDNRFTVTAGTSVTLSSGLFGGIWAVTPKCVVSGNSTVAFPSLAAVSTTAWSIGWSASVSGVIATVDCGG